VDATSSYTVDDVPNFHVAVNVDTNPTFERHTIRNASKNNHHKRHIELSAPNMQIMLDSIVNTVAGNLYDHFNEHENHMNSRKVMRQLAIDTILDLLIISH
jgi:hypothetical protein